MPSYSLIESNACDEFVDPSQPMPLSLAHDGVIDDRTWTAFLGAINAFATRRLRPDRHWPTKLTQPTVWLLAVVASAVVFTAFVILALITLPPLLDCDAKVDAHVRTNGISPDVIRARCAVGNAEILTLRTRVPVGLIVAALALLFSVPRAVPFGRLYAIATRPLPRRTAYAAVLRVLNDELASVQVRLMPDAHQRTFTLDYIVDASPGAHARPSDVFGALRRARERDETDVCRWARAMYAQWRRQWMPMMRRGGLTPPPPVDHERGE